MSIISVKMEELLHKSIILSNQVQMDYQRGLHDQVHWKSRMIGIMGARGTGKTTLLLQHLRSLPSEEKALYISMDDLYFTTHTLVETAEAFMTKGGTLLLLDEVHKYPTWSREIKNIYDTYPTLKIVFTGSSIINIYRQEADLSRRVVFYTLSGLSFREYLFFETGKNFPVYDWKTLLTDHVSIAMNLVKEIKPLVYFEEYLKRGYYPFYKEDPEVYTIKLEQVVRLVVEDELRFIEGFDYHNIRKMYQLLGLLATSVPFKPNISELSNKTGVNRNTLVQYLYYLEKAKLLATLTASGKSTAKLQKPDKIYLDNPNLHYVLGSENQNKGSLREAFFLNQLRNAHHEVELPAKGDFIVDQQYTVEVGGKNKTHKQLQGIADSYLVLDDTEIGVNNKIPLWLIGFLY